MSADEWIALSWMAPIYGAVLLVTVATVHAATRTRPAALAVALWLVVPPLAWWAVTRAAGRWLALLNAFVEPPLLAALAAGLYLWSQLSASGEDEHRRLVAFVLAIATAVATGAFFPSLGGSP